MATNGNPKYIVNAYHPSGQLSGFAYYDDAEEMVRNYRRALAVKRESGGTVKVVRCSDSQEIADPEAEIVS